MKARESVQPSFWQNAGRTALAFWDGACIFLGFSYGIDPHVTKASIAAGRIGNQAETFLKDVTAQLLADAQEL